MWEIQTAINYKSDILDEGWEPYAVTFEDGLRRYHFRRQVPEKLDANHLTNEQLTIMANDRVRVRAETLKEVGKWLMESSLNEGNSLIHKISPAELWAFKEGQMP